MVHTLLAHGSFFFLRVPAGGTCDAGDGEGSGCERASGTSASAGGDSSGDAGEWPVAGRAPPSKAASPASARAPAEAAAARLFLPARSPAPSCSRTPARLRSIWSSSAIDELLAVAGERAAELTFVAGFASFARAPAPTPFATLAFSFVAVASLTRTLAVLAAGLSEQRESR